jgi:transposase
VSCSGELLRRLNAVGQLDWSTGVVDGSHIRALRGGPLTGRSPVDRARTGSKHHLIVGRHGIPLAATLTAGHRNDVTQLIPLIDGIGAIAGKRGRPRQRPDQVIADRGYDHDKYRRELSRQGVTPRIARRRTEHGSGLGRVRWVVERTFAWLHNFRRLRIRWERDAALGSLLGYIELGGRAGTGAIRLSGLVCSTPAHDQRLAGLGPSASGAPSR